MGIAVYLPIVRTNQITFSFTGTAIWLFLGGVVNEDMVGFRSSYWRGVGDRFVDSDRVGVLEYSVEAKNAAGVVISTTDCTNGAADVVVQDATPEGLRVTYTDRSRAVINWQNDGPVEIQVDADVVGADSDGWYTIRDLEPGTNYSVRIRFEGATQWSPRVMIRTNP